MPIEIREMIIKARIEPDGRRPPGKAAETDDCACKSTVTADDLTRLLNDRNER
jgi:hypothetical protein